MKRRWRKGITLWGLLALAGGCSSGASTSSDGGIHAADARARDGAVATADAASPADAAPSEGARLGLLVFGGFDGDELLADSWIWDGDRWDEVSAEAGVSPPARGDHAMVYDRGRDRVVLFGGFDADSNPLGDTWEWDGDRWEQASFEGTSPPARFWHAMAYDPGREAVVLFGGTSTGEDFLADTWHWNGTAWESFEGSAPARSKHAMSYDPIRETVVLFGGDDAGFDRPGDMWEWDGATWRELFPPTGGALPPARAEHAMATHHDRERIVVFGGIGPFGVVLEDTWEWDGTRWQELTPRAGGPAGRYWHAMAYDANLGRVALFGGATGANNLMPNELWLWDGWDWESRDATPAPSARRFHALTQVVAP